MNKHELSAWWRLVLSTLLGVYLGNVLFFSKDGISKDGWEEVRGNLNILLVVILLLDAWLRRRQGIAEDERDRAISGIASRDALVALAILVLATPFILTRPFIAAGNIHSDLYRIALNTDWFDFYVLACVTFAVWVEAAITVFHHWRDRR